MDHRKSSSSSDEPPLSRLFIIGPKELTEKDYRNHFEEFGTIEEVWMVNDKITGEYKGITYIKFSKTSEAANALERMNGAQLGEGTRRLRVRIASSRDQGNTKRENDEEKQQRLFIVCPKSATEDELHDYFQKWGDLDYVSVIKDRNTRESKGIAYVKFHKFSHAAKAFEECDRKYKPVFAEPKNDSALKRGGDGGMGFRDPYGRGPIPSLLSSNLMGPSPPPLLPPPRMGGSTPEFHKLTVVASPDITEDQMWSLFDLIPGLDFCHVRYQGGPMGPSRAVADVAYVNPDWAAYAQEKFHGFEYPPGFRLIVKPVFGPAPLPPPGSAPRPLLGGPPRPLFGDSPRDTPKKDIVTIAETIAQATSIIKAAGLDPSAILNLKGLASDGSGDSGIKCSVNLPDPRPLADIDSECVARCFIVCINALPNATLRDVFCRFGNLIEAYMLPNRNCGYARYASKDSCEQAIKTLHGAEINGVRMKVIEADEPRKRPRTDD